MVTDPFTTDDIADVFPIIEPFIERLYLEFGGLPPKDVKRKLLSRAATLHLVGDDAFIVAQWSEDRCHVLCAASMVGHVGDWSAIISSTANYVKQLGCSKLTFTSPREGWGRVAPKLGFRAESITYAMEV